MGGDPAKELMARAQAGDREAFDDLVRSLHRVVFSFARRATSDPELAADATQETFVRAYRYRASYDPRFGTPRGWLLAIARNCARDALRSGGRRPAPISDLASVPAEERPSGDVREEVQRALDSLPPDQREVLALKYLSDLTYAEVAQALDLTTGAAKMRALRAREALAERLRGRLEGWT